MNINTLLSERMTFNNFLFSMSFPDIVNYLERNPRDMSKVEWDLFTNSKIRTSKNIDNYPELILKHPNWPWRFNIKQIQEELSRKISKLSKLSNVDKVTPKVSSDNWIDKVINSMEKLCEKQNKMLIQDTQNFIKETKIEEKKEKEISLLENIAQQIIKEEMPPEDPDEDDPEDFGVVDQEDFENDPEDFDEYDLKDLDDSLSVD